MIAFRPVLYLLGMLLSTMAAAMLIPLIAELFVFKTDGWQEFAVAFFLTGALGSLLAMANRSTDKIELKVREAFLMTALCWIITPLFAALPIYWSDLNLTYLDSWFEAVSAITTTGSTIIAKLNSASKGVLLWRSILQWLGGTGIILMALIILPTLRIGGMQLFRSEFSDKSEKILPRVSQISSAITSIYVFFTVACFFSLYLAGMTPFDAICHAMSTVSTGGLSTKDASIAFYKSWVIEFIIIIFSILGSFTFVLFIRLWHGHAKAIAFDSQVQMFLRLISFFVVILFVWSWAHLGISPIKAFRESLFVVTSLATSSGFTTIDYTTWGAFPCLALLIVSIIGGCTGSTAGGLKVFRIQVLGHVALTHLRQLRRPHGVFIPLYQGQKIPESVSSSVLTFTTLYFFTAFCLAGVLTLFDLSIIDAFSASIAVLSNTGPGVTKLIGPSGSLASLDSGAKLSLMIGMTLGRLELLTIFVLLMPSFWKR
ncbi:MAG: TrkH family potassium uptake protein [Candidatus Paracaedibacteraceae bacterium]|nr:TrkH family potassium uptake protein [Candidatus Paracaedibacteraceae bacterium]